MFIIQMSTETPRKKKFQHLFRPGPGLLFISELLFLHTC